MRQSFSNTNGALNTEKNLEDIPAISVIPQLPHVNTQDPLIASDQSVYNDIHETNPLHVPALSTCKRVLYGLAAPPSPMCTNILGFLMTVYLLEVAKLPPKYILSIVFAGRFWDAISDPLIGFMVSRTRTRFGQCRIWVILSAPLCGISFFFLFHTPSWDSEQGRYVYYFVMYLVFCTFLTTYHIPYTSMTMLISDRPVDRDAATTLRMVFEMLGTLVGVMTFTFVTQHGEDRCSGLNATSVAEVSSEEESRYRLGAGVIGSVVLLCGCVGFFGTEEVVRPSSKAEAAGGESDTILRAFRRCLSHRPYRILMLTFMLSSLAIQIVQNTLALYTIYSLGMKRHLKYAIAIVMSVAIVATPGVFCLIRRLGKKRVYGIGLLLILPVCVSALACPADPAFVPLYYVTMLVAGCFVSINMLLPWIMLPDVIDDYTASGGRHDQATFYSLYVFFTKFAVGVSAALQQLALHVAGYRQPPACDQPPLVGSLLRVVIGPVPIVTVLLGLLLLRRYPITPEYRLLLDERLRKAREGDGVELQLGASVVADDEAVGACCAQPSELYESSDRIVDGCDPTVC